MGKKSQAAKRRRRRLAFVILITLLALLTVIFVVIGFIEMLERSRQTALGGADGAVRRRNLRG